MLGTEVSDLVVAQAWGENNRRTGTIRLAAMSFRPQPPSQHRRGSDV